MAKRVSGWMPLAAALIASLGLGSGEGMATHAVDIADAITVNTARVADGKALQIGVALVLSIKHEVVWDVLNDYENMPRFVPDILAVRLISAGAGRKRVEIEGVARLLFLEYPTRTILEVMYLPDGSITLNSVAGNLTIHGVVRVHGNGTYTRVDYQVRMTPDFWLPPLIGDFLISRQVKRQFEGMASEMHRRADNRQVEGRAPGRLRLSDTQPAWGNSWFADSESEMPNLAESQRAAGP
ncbi:SRPBCC family protein [Thiobacillus sp.]|uniref:SRPBCC family protein n=1 Tax=Thiobacillus sp. TaxID=924 RepID=UPI0011D9046D|nr:SRPBCC family protein [Thiobacillus sp.]TXH75239.1 MAG: hypothetical protein E6Q82_06875 [Thiobacillus sp.]